MRSKKEQTRKLIMDAAYTLFRRRAFARVNVDEIADAAGVTKRTLYDYFESKDALLTAVLDDQNELALAAFQTFGRNLAGTPEEIISSLFDELLRWSGKPRFPGSGFTRLAMELADLPGHPARRIASRHKQLLEAALAEMLAKAGLADATRHARQIWLLCEGAMALVLIHGDRTYCKAAQQAALLLVRER
jgi:AcrR family transcriptional regulator